MVIVPLATIFDTRQTITRNNFRLISMNSFAPPRNYNFICYKCSTFGHIAKACRSGVADFSERNMKDEKVDKEKEVSGIFDCANNLYCTKLQTEH